jgi:DNA-binding CsgD family transcriptional regulator
MEKIFFDEKFFKTHPMFTLSQHVKEICQPFFDSLSINYFDYIRINKDKKIVGLVTDPNWLKHFFEKTFTFGGTVKTSGNHLWQSYNNELLLHDARTYFNHDNGISVFYLKENYIEYFDIAAPKENKAVLSLYLNRFDILENFFHHFLEQSQQLLSQVSLHPIIPPKEMQGIFTTEEDLIYKFNHSIFYKISKRTFNCPSLTPRENECISYLVLGFTAKEVGKVLNLSHRTVEQYINNVKIKLGCTYRSELIRKYISVVGWFYLSKAIKDIL